MSDFFVNVVQWKKVFGKLFRLEAGARLPSPEAAGATLPSPEDGGHGYPVRFEKSTPQESIHLGVEVRYGDIESLYLSSFTTIFGPARTT